MSSDEPSSALKVLVVEDEVMVGLLAEDMLTTLGHTVVGPLAHLKEAVEAAKRETLDLAMLDINLDGHEVFPVAEVLDSRQIPFIFVSGYGNWRLRNSDQGRPVIQKPYTIEDLRVTIARIMPLVHSRQNDAKTPITL